MDFELSEEQRLLKQSVERLLADRYGFEQRTAYMKEQGGFSRALWKQYAELGLLALPFAEEDGGIGGGPVDIMIVMEALGARARARAVSRDRRARGRRAAPRRKQNAARRHRSENRRWKPHSRARAFGAAVALRSCRCRDDREERRRRLCARRRQGPRLARRQRRPVHRLGTPLRQTARPRRHRALPRRRQGEGRSRSAAIRPSTASAPPRSRFPA